MKSSVSLIALVGALFIAGQSHAFGIADAVPNGKGKEVVKVASKVAGKAIEASINDKLAKEKCVFVDDKSDTKTKCASGSLDDVIKYVVKWKKGLEASIAQKVSVDIKANAKDKALAVKRSDFVGDSFRSKISYWDYNNVGLKGKDNSFAVSVNVD